MSKHSVYVPVEVLARILEEERVHGDQPLHNYLGVNIVEAIEDWYIRRER